MGSRYLLAKIGDGSAETPAKPDPRGNEPNTDYENLQFFFHSDHLGSTSYMTDLSGEVSQHVEYFPYGGVMTEERTSGTENPYLFNGKELDMETGLYYFHARYYDGNQWITPDPLAEHPNQLGKSPYLFSWGNPVNFNDPNGLCPDCDENAPDAQAGDTYRPEGAGHDYLKGKDGTWTMLAGNELGGITITPEQWSSFDPNSDVLALDEVIVAESQQKKTKAQLQGDRQISIDENHNRIGFVPLDVGQNYGAYQMANYRANISIRGNQNKIFVGVTNSNTPVSGGQVVFNASASLVVNGDVIQRQALVNGSARFNLPPFSNVSLTVKGGWSVYFDSGGASVPVYHPIFLPFSLNFKDNFKLK